MFVQCFRDIENGRAPMEAIRGEAEEIIDRSLTPVGESAALDAESARVLKAIRGMP
jgi:hypothetical protein